MPEVSYHDLTQLRNQKQNKIATIKQGLFHSGEGQDGDIGVCLYNGKHYFAVKNFGEWLFAEAIRAGKLFSKNTFTVKG